MTGDMETPAPEGADMGEPDPDDQATDDTSGAPVAQPRPEDMSPSERANLAAFMDAERLKVIGNKCVRRYESDLNSRADRMRKLDQLQKMYALIAELKNFPWQNCANIKTPALSGPTLQIQARLFDMIWPPSGKIFNVVPASVQDQEFAHVAEQFANSYVRYNMPYMAQGLDDTIHQMVLYGSSFRRTYWDIYENKGRSDWIPIEDFVVAFKQRSQDPSLSDVPRYTMLHEMTLADIETYEAEGLFVQADMVKGKPERKGSEFSETSRRIDGVQPGEEDEDDDTPRQVLEQHCSLKLPNTPHVHPSFDGKEHKVYITLDAVSEVVLRISLREEDDPDDKRRFDREMARFDQYRQELDAYQAQQAAPPAPAGPPALPDSADMTAPPAPAAGPPDTSGPPGLAALMGGAGAPPPPPLQEPEPVAPPRPVRRRQICFFTHYRCFPCEGFYGLGYGDLLYGLAVAQNTVINQWSDGMAVKNAKPMFMSRQVRMQRGAINIGPGQITEVDAPGGAIRDAIVFLDPPQADPGTVPLIKMLDSMKDVIAGNGDLMSGQAPGSNQTKAGMQILNEQLMAPITVLARRVKEAFRHELTKIWRCWGVFLEDDDVMDVVGDGGQPTQLRIGKAMFSPSVHLVPASDPRMKSQRRDDFQELFGFCLNNPFISQNPQVGPAVMAKLTEMGMRLFPDGEQLVPMLHPPPAPPPQPKDQIEENAGFLTGQDSQVHPLDDDTDHLNKLHGFMGSPEAQAMDPKGHVMAQNHLRGHLAARMMKMRGQPNGPGGNAPFTPGGPGSSGMAPVGAFPPSTRIPPGGPPGIA